MSLSLYTPGTPQAVTGLDTGALGGGTFRDGTGAWRYEDGKKVRVDYVPEGSPECQKKRRAWLERPVERDDGVVYGSIGEACGAMGRSQSGGIAESMRRGGTYAGHYWRYVGEPWPERHGRAHTGTLVRCVETGRTWDTQRECAQAVGSTEYQVKYALDRGTPLKADGRHYERVEDDGDERLTARRERKGESG